MIDNFSRVPEIAEFKEGSYYKFSLIIRGKDNPDIKDAKQHVVKFWFVSSEDYLQSKVLEMKLLADAVNGRIYMDLDRRSLLKTLASISNKVNARVTEMLFSQQNLTPKSILGLIDSASSVSESSDGANRWLFDIDVKDEDIPEKIKKEIGDSYLSILDTVNGRHLIAKRNFNAHHIFDNIGEAVGCVTELKQNAKTLIYYKGATQNGK